MGGRASAPVIIFTANGLRLRYYIILRHTFNPYDEYDVGCAAKRAWLAHNRPAFLRSLPGGTCFGSVVVLWFLRNLSDWNMVQPNCGGKEGQTSPSHLLIITFSPPPIVNAWQWLARPPFITAFLERRAEIEGQRKNYSKFVSFDRRENGLTSQYIIHNCYYTMQYACDGHENIAYSTP